MHSNAYNYIFLEYKASKYTHFHYAMSKDLQAFDSLPQSMCLLLVQMKLKHTHTHIYTLNSVTRL